jgi:hypothetical protein
MHKRSRIIPEDESYISYQTIALIVLAMLLVIWCIVFQTTWQVADNYKFIRSEYRTSLKGQQKIVFDNKFKGSKMKIEIGWLGSYLTLYNNDGSVNKKFSGELPFYFIANVTEVDPSSGAYLSTSDGSKWMYEYKRYKGGWPNIIITNNDKDGQFISKWIYTVDAPVKRVVLK